MSKDEVYRFTDDVNMQEIIVMTLVMFNHCPNILEMYKPAINRRRISLHAKKQHNFRSC